MRDAVGNSYVTKINIKHSQPIVLQECDFSVKYKKEKPVRIKSSIWCENSMQ